MKLETIQLATGDMFMSDYKITKEQVREGINGRIHEVGMSVYAPRSGIRTREIVPSSGKTVSVVNQLTGSMRRASGSGRMTQHGCEGFNE